VNRVCWVLGSLWSCLVAAVAGLCQGSQSNRAQPVCSLIGQVTPPHPSLIRGSAKEWPTRFSTNDCRGQKRFDSSAKRTATPESRWRFLAPFEGTWGSGSFYRLGAEFLGQIPGGRSWLHWGLIRGPDWAVGRCILFLGKFPALTRGPWMTFRGSLGFPLLVAS
jgi:hypothetical protein